MDVQTAMTSNERVSIIIPCFNLGEFLPDAIGSAESCDEKLREIIIVDDGSTDPGTLEILAALSKKYTVLRQPNLGLASARNKGIEAANGRYILPLDADNKIRARYIERSLAVFARYPDVGIIYSDKQLFGLKTGVVRVGPFDILRILYLNYIDACVVFRKKVWEDCGGFDARMPMQGLEDWDFWLSAIEKNWKFHYEPEVLFDYRVRPYSMIARTKTPTNQEALLRYIYAKHHNLVREQIEQERYLCQYYERRFWLFRHWEHLVREPFFKLKRFTQLVRSLGPAGAITFLRYQAAPAGTATPERLPALKILEARHPLKFRPGTTDLKVINQIFVENAYGLADVEPASGLIVDCGAYAGYSAAYFLTLFPNCSLIAVEPDPENYALLAENMRPYGDRAKAIRAGIWSHPAELVISGETYRDGEHWSRQIRERKNGETPFLKGVHLGALLKESGRDRISLLKIDIEGAEAVVFSRGYEDWLAKVDAIVAELHDDSSFGHGTEVFFQAISKFGFSAFQRGELTFCRRAERLPCI